MSKEELLDIKGGISKWLFVGVGAAITFIVGVIDGYLRPLKCNK